MGLSEALQLIRNVENAVYRIDKLEKEQSKLKDKVALLEKDNEHFTQKEIALNRKQIKNARLIQHQLIRDVYDMMMLKINKEHDNQKDFSVALRIQAKAIEHYYAIMERTHLEEGTHPRIISMIMKAMGPSIKYIIDQYGADYEKLFTQISNGTRRLALKNATDLYCKELCLVFDENLYKIYDNELNYNLF